MGDRREKLEEALSLAKSALPGWAWSHIHKATRGEADDESLSALGEILEGASVRSFRPGSPLIFVVAKANPVEEARGEFLTGPDGLAFRESYLDPLGVTKSQVSIVSSDQIELLESLGGGLIVALGRVAKSVLGPLADYTLPHPNALRRFGDSGEVGRKVRKILKDPRLLREPVEEVFEGKGVFVVSSKSLDLVSKHSKRLFSFKLASSDLPPGVGKFEVESSVDGAVNLFIDGKIKKGRYSLECEDKSSESWTIKVLTDSDGVVSDASGSIEGHQQVEQERVSHEVPILKADSEKQIVYGVVLDPYQVDAHKDWISPKTIEETAHGWMAKSRVIGFNHEKKANAQAVESWLVPYPTSADYKNAMDWKDHKAYTFPLGNDVVHSGSWVLGTKLSDDEWKRVQSGEINAYSIGGFGARRETTFQEMPKVEFLDLAEGLNV